MGAGFCVNDRHPNGRCYATPILKTHEEVVEDNKRILRGEEPIDPSESQNYVKENGLPQGFKDWVTNNSERIEIARNRGTLPYFVRDNFGVVNDTIQSEKYDDAIEKARGVSVELQDKTISIADKYNSLVTPINLKSKESTIQKLNTPEIDGDINKIYDLVRNTIIVDAQRDIDNIIGEIKRNFTIPVIDGEQRIKKQSTSMGYTGVLVNVRVNGVVGEIQINTPQMIYAKEPNAKSLLPKNIFDNIAKKSGLKCGLGHKYYEEWRREGTTEERKKELEKLSRQYYEAIRRVRL